LYITFSIDNFYYSCKIHFDKINFNIGGNMKKLILVIAILSVPFALSQATTPVNTFSIVGCDPATGELGVAVASRYFAVGSVVPWAKADIGAIATQAWVNPDYGIIGLELLQKGMTPQAVIDSLTKADTLSSRRQLGIIDLKGQAVTFTGKGCMNWAGGKVGKNCAAQGNILVSDTVVANMIHAFENTQGDLSEKLLAALLAGDSAGGDSRGKQSAAIYVVQKTEGELYDRKIDIRVDDSPEPFKEITRLYHIAAPLTHLESASTLNRKGDLAGAVREARLAVQLGPTMPETYYDLACYLSLSGNLDEAMKNITASIQMTPGFKSMAAADSDLRALKDRQDFKALVK
jgi:uncharacterized Ntn-hydrolase superfamily protein